MKNKVIRGVLAAACVTTAVSAANVFGAGTEQSLVNEASAVTQEETEEKIGGGNHRRKYAGDDRNGDAGFDSGKCRLGSFRRQK